MLLNIYIFFIYSLTLSTIHSLKKKKKKLQNRKYWWALYYSYGGNFERQYFCKFFSTIWLKKFYFLENLSFHISSKRTKYVIKKNKNQILSSTEQSAQIRIKSGFMNINERGQVPINHNVFLPTTLIEPFYRRTWIALTLIVDAPVFWCHAHFFSHWEKANREMGFLWCDGDNLYRLPFLLLFIRILSLSLSVPHCKINTKKKLTIILYMHSHENYVYNAGCCITIQLLDICNWNG